MADHASPVAQHLALAESFDQLGEAEQEAVRLVAWEELSLAQAAAATGRAFGLDSSYTGLPTRYTLVVDEATGAILDYEQMLTTTAGKLKVQVPAVIGYGLFETSERTSSMD